MVLLGDTAQNGSEQFRELKFWCFCLSQVFHADSPVLFFRICQDGNARKTEKAKQDLQKLKEGLQMTEPEYSPGVTPSARDLLNARELEKLDVEYHKMLVARPTKWHFILAWEFWHIISLCLFRSGFISRQDFLVL